eukprot:11165551-Lingulodinium_polyedra.AAC.1
MRWALTPRGARRQARRPALAGGLAPRGRRLRSPSWRRSPRWRMTSCWSRARASWRELSATTLTR